MQFRRPPPSLVPTIRSPLEQTATPALDALRDRNSSAAASATSRAETLRLRPTPHIRRAPRALSIEQKHRCPRCQDCVGHSASRRKTRSRQFRPPTRNWWDVRCPLRLWLESNRSEGG